MLPPKKKAKTARHYTLKEKYEAINEYEEKHVPKSVILQKYSVSRSVFNRWLKASAAINASYHPKKI